MDYDIHSFFFYISFGAGCCGLSSFLNGFGAIMNYTYMLVCADGSFYTGWTNDLKRRLEAHNKGKNGAKYTKAKRPVKLIYYEGFHTKEEAMRREYFIKQMTRRQKEELIS